ncbi:hypothetical protein AB0M79_16265 [Polymorphospora sp. NPDC051019]|uniref:hypothetical protein n=1 Tax=Polymorphospora sp. NPDC051019 TaxID=3155725 RepID=UPI0034141FB9
MEQPPAEPADRKPRKRTPKAAFTPAEPTGTAAAPAPRARRAKAAAPAVLFQPPAAGTTSGRRADARADDSRDTGDGAGSPDVPAARTPASNEGAGDGAGTDAAKRPARKTAARRTPAKTATTAAAKKASPAKKTAAKKTTAAKKAAATEKATPAKTPRRKAAPADADQPTDRQQPAPREPVEQQPTGQHVSPEPAASTEVTDPRITDRAGDPAPVEMTGRAPEATVRRTGEGAGPATSRLVDHPGFAPELLALAAVRRQGPAAAAWAERLRAEYPTATPDGLARLATRRFVRLAGAGGAVSAAAGLLAPLAELAAVAWTQTDLVLHLAAAYGHDPAHPDRAVELLVLTQVHPDETFARAALDAALGARPDGRVPARRAAEAAWRLATPLVAQAGGWLALRLAARLLPGAALLAATAGDSAAAQRLAARAVARYRVGAA